LTVVCKWWDLSNCNVATCFSVYLASCILSLIRVAVASACTSRIPASRALAAMAARVKIRWHSNQLSGEKKRRGEQTASGTRRCCLRRQFARRNCVRAAALPITNRDVLDLTDRSRESSRRSRSRIILERGRERKWDSKGKRVLFVEYRVMHIHEEFAEHLLSCTRAGLCTEALGSPWNIPINSRQGGFLKCKCANFESVIS